MKTTLGASFFLIGAILSEEAKAQLPYCNQSTQKDHVYALTPLPLDRVLNIHRRTVISGDGQATTRRKNQKSVHSKQKPDAGCHGPARFEFYALRKDFEKSVDAEGKIAVSILPDFKSSGLSKTRMCLDVPIGQVQRENVGRNSFKLSIRLDETVSMMRERTDYFYKFPKDSNENVFCYRFTLPEHMRPAIPLVPTAKIN